MSLKAFKSTRSIRRWEHLFGGHLPRTVSRNKRFSRRSERRQANREVLRLAVQ